MPIVIGKERGGQNGIRQLFQISLLDQVGRQYVNANKVEFLTAFAKAYDLELSAINPQEYAFYSRKEFGRKPVLAVQWGNKESLWPDDISVIKWNDDFSANLMKLSVRDDVQDVIDGKANPNLI